MRWWSESSHCRSPLFDLCCDGNHHLRSFWSIKLWLAWPWRGLSGCTCAAPLCQRRGWGVWSSCTEPAHLAWTDLLQLGTGNSAKPGFWKVWFSFLFHYECIALKSINAFKIYEDRCINNFESVGLSVFVSPAPRCSSAMAWPYLALVLPGTCSPRGYPGIFCGDMW